MNTPITPTPAPDDERFNLDVLALQFACVLAPCPQYVGGWWTDVLARDAYEAAAAFRAERDRQYAKRET